MNVCACSAFRNSTSYLTRYFVQMAALRRELVKRGDSLHLILCEGDHTDATRSMLPGWLTDFDSTLIHYDHGQPNFGSVVNLERFAMLAGVWNRIWAQIPEDADAVLFVESDLIWHPNTMMRLIDHTREYPAMAPMVMLQREGYPSDAYYDCWGMRKDGLPFNHRPPYFQPWPVSEPVRIDAAGSCMAIQGDIARRLMWPAEDVVRGVCRQIYELGGSVWIDSALEIFHP